jgi:hypothetical protein
MTEIRSYNKSHTSQTKIKELIEKNEGLKGTGLDSRARSLRTERKQAAG